MIPGTFVPVSDMYVNGVMTIEWQNFFRDLLRYVEAWPVGSVFVTVVDTNPNSLLGYGEWTQFGSGKVLVGVDSSDPDFASVEQTGGSKTHDHPSSTSGSPSSTVQVDNDGSGSTTSVGDGNHTHDVDLGSIDHMPPYITVYFWKRIG